MACFKFLMWITYSVLSCKLSCKFCRNCFDFSKASNEEVKWNHGMVLRYLVVIVVLHLVM